MPLYRYGVLSRLTVMDDERSSRFGGTIYHHSLVEKRLSLKQLDTGSSPVGGTDGRR